MKKVIFALAFVGLLFGHDFSKMSNEELINLSGKVEVKEVADYQIELYKRIKEMKKPDAKEFHKKLKEAMEKNTENMTLKEFKERMEAIKQAVGERIKSMSKEECKKSGLCHFYKHLDHKKEACPHHDDKPKDKKPKKDK